MTHYSIRPEAEMTAWQPDRAPVDQRVADRHAQVAQDALPGTPEPPDERHPFVDPPGVLFSSPEADECGECGDPEGDWKHALPLKDDDAAYREQIAVRCHICGVDRGQPCKPGCRWDPRR